MKEEIKSISKDEMIDLFKSNISNVNKFAKPVTCCDQYGKFLYKRSCTYPVEYIVTDELQEIASEYRKRMERECLNQIKEDDLVLLRMGGNFYENRDLENSDLENHRLHLSFIDKNGVQVSGDICSCHSIKSKGYINDMQDKPIMSFDLQYSDQTGTYLYKSNELFDMSKLGTAYTKQNLLNIINRYSAKQYNRVFICNECVSYEEFKKVTDCYFIWS